jgi:hypothetical protein
MSSFIYGNDKIISVKMSPLNNNMLIKQKEIDKKKQEILNNVNNLMEMIIRILKNQKIKDLSYEKMYRLAYKICNEKAYNEIYENLQKNFRTHLQLIYDELENYYLKFEEISQFVLKMIENYEEYIYRISIIQKTLLYYEKNFLERQTLKTNSIININIKANINDVKNINSNLQYEENIKDFANKIFFEIFINDKTTGKLMEFILCNFEKNRNNIFVDKFLLTKVIDFFIQIKSQERAYYDLIEKNLILSSIKFYEENFFQKEFLRIITISIDNLDNNNFDNKNNFYFFHMKNFFEKFYFILNHESNLFEEFNITMSRNKFIEEILANFFEKIFQMENIFIEFLIYLLKNPDKEVINNIKNCFDFIDNININNRDNNYLIQRKTTNFINLISLNNNLNSYNNNSKSYIL